MRMKKGGAAAWDSPVPVRQLSAGDQNALIAHAASDETGLVSYLPSVRKWLVFAEEYGLNITWIRDRDVALADYLAYLCHHEDAGLESGRTAKAAVEAIYPEMNHRIPLTARALVSWARLHVSGEGSPTTWTAVCRLPADMVERGEEGCGHILLIAADCYLRASDWSQVRKADVVGPHSPHDPFRMAILLGIPERGATTKTGGSPPGPARNRLSLVLLP